VLAMLGCPESAKTTEDMCFHVGYRVWHSAMITIAPHDSLLGLIREKVLNSGLAHMPQSYCFLFKGHPLDPTVEATMRATEVATKSSQHLLLFIDTLQCASATPPKGKWVKWLAISFAGCILAICVCMPMTKRVYEAKQRSMPHKGGEAPSSKSSFDCVPLSELRNSRFFACIPSVKARAALLVRGRRSRPHKEGGAATVADTTDAIEQAMASPAGGDDDDEVRQHLLP